MTPSSFVTSLSLFAYISFAMVEFFFREELTPFCTLFGNNPTSPSSLLIKLGSLVESMALLNVQRKSSKKTLVTWGKWAKKGSKNVLGKKCTFKKRTWSGRIDAQL